MLNNSKTNNKDICQADNATMHTILPGKKYFSKLTNVEAKFNKISGLQNLIERFGKSNIIFPRGTKSTIDITVL